MSAIETRDKHILLPNSEGHRCFGCSPSNSSGMHMQFYISEDRDSVTSWYSVPEHLCGWVNVVHGGIVATMLDEAMGWACLSILRKLLLSKSMEVEFLRPITVGEELRIVGSVKESNSEREAVMQGCIYNGKDHICARSSSTVSLFPLEAIRKMGIVDEAILSNFERILDEGN